MMIVIMVVLITIETMINTTQNTMVDMMVLDPMDLPLNMIILSSIVETTRINIVMR